MDSSGSDAVFNSDTQGLIEMEPSIGNMKLPVGHACRKSKRSAVESTKNKEKREQAVSSTTMKKCAKRPRLKCGVCSSGFQKKRALLKHKQSHVSGALSERYSETSASCGRQGSVASVQRYLTLNIAMAMKLRESRSYDRHKPAFSGGVANDIEIKRGLKGPKLKQKNRTEKPARIPRHHKMDRVVSSKIQSDTTLNTPVVKREMKGMTKATQSSTCMVHLSEHDDGLECLSSESPLKVSAKNVSMSDKSKETSRTVLEMVTDAWNILDSDSPEVPQPRKFNLKAEPKEATLHVHVCTIETTEDESQGSTLSSQQTLGESLQSNKKKRAIQLDPLNQTSSVTAMHDGVIELVTRLQGDRDKHVIMPPILQSDETTTCAESKSSSECSDDSDDDDDDVDSDTNWNDESQTTVGSGQEPSSKMRRRNRTKRSTFCEICQKDFKHLNKHLFIHYGERKHQCKVCGKAFYEARVLDKHETTHLKKFKCGVCGEMFSKIRAAKRHAQIHVPDKPYSCEICKQSFRSRSHVRKHMSVHSSIRQFVCDICGQGMRSSTALNSHKRKHTGEKPYVCEICGKSFRYSSGLHVHNFSHTSGKPYPCPICRESFAHNYLKKRHLLTHTSDAPSVMDSQGEVSRSLSSLNTCHTVQEDKCLSVQQLSSNSETVARVSHMERTSSAEEPLMQGADQETFKIEQPTTQAFSQPSTQDDQSMFANEAKRMNKVLGPDSFKHNLMYGTGSRRQTPADFLVLSMCDGSYKSLKALRRQGVEIDDLPKT